MIHRLYIRNYAIIEELDIQFAKGLTIITGETGAGKSILLGALGLIMGKRADTKALYDESEKCVVEAVFQVGKYQIRPFFEQNDIDYEEEVIIRRELTPSGKSRAFVNDSPVTLKILQELSGALLDLHQQFDTLDIHQSSYQLRMLDALAGQTAALETYQQAFTDLQKNRRQLEQWQKESIRAQQESDFLQFQLDELEKANLQPGEQEELEEEEALLSNAEDIQQILGTTRQHLTESENALVDQLETLGRELQSLRKAGSAFDQLADRFQSLIIELQDLSNEFEIQAGQVEFQPKRLSEVQQRLDLLYRLQNKHQLTDVNGLLNLQEDLQKRLHSFADLSQQSEQLAKKISEQEKNLKQQALKLRGARQNVAPDFQCAVLERLSLLSMEHARLEVQFTQLEDFGPDGLDEVQFLFAANKGGRLQPIRSVASGGELSRLALVTKSLVASAIPLPTLIFDEIDTGISGDVALRMGQILRQLSDEHQVVTITHSPQVASKADSHYFVYKKEKKDRTVTKVKALDEAERIQAIATMLSQSPPTTSAIANAKELLEL